MAMLLVSVGCAIICMLMAEKRGRNQIMGFALGLIFSWVAIIGYWIAGDSKQLREEKTRAIISELAKEVKKNNKK